MKFHKINKNDTHIYENYKETVSDDDILNYETYVSGNNYFIINQDKKFTLKWIYAPGHGDVVFQHIINIAKKNYDTIYFNISIDKNELQETILRRLNFYSKYNYKTFNVKYRKHGILLECYLKV